MTMLPTCTGVPDSIGVVVIGRNEGARLRRSLRSVLGRGIRVVYVDSGSTDGSVALARSLGCRILELDSSRPFSAARARNEGLAALTKEAPEVAYVQYLDGDSELHESWPARGAEVLDARPDVCAVIGRLREAHPEASVYNRACQIEWNLPPGDVHCFGGMVFARVEAIQSTGGFDASLVAGEEPELAQRLRRAGWVIVSVPEEMAIHDAAITRFGQWWKRAYRTGHAYAQVCWMGTGIRDRFGLRQSFRIWFWVFVLPLTAVAAAVVQPLALLAVPALYLAQMIRVAIGRIREGHDAKIATFYAVTWLPSLAAQWLGQCRFLLGKVTHRHVGLIEHKVPAPDAAAEGTKAK